MKRLVFLITIMLGTVFFAHSQTVIHLNMSHNPVKADVPFPLLSDSLLKANEAFYNVLYPKLVVNIVIISDTAALNCFRNHFDRTKIATVKQVSAEKARKMGVPNVPKDGVIFVTTKKGYFFDFSCK